MSNSMLFSFGLISDVQWCDIPDGASFHGTPRYYREALVCARRAVKHFNEKKVTLAIHLGDIVDYHATKHGQSEMALQAAVECFDNLECQTVLHCIGNHCLYNAPRHVLNHRLGIDTHKAATSSLSGQHSYFSYTPQPGFRFLILDGYDISILGWPEGHPFHQRALEILNSNNPNTDKNSNNGLQGLNRRFVKFGGGCSDTQLEWLREELEDGRRVGDRVIVCSHLCLHPSTCASTCLLWNFDEVLSILESFSDVVVATLAGHAHRDGYYFDETTGIHHRVCQGVLETEPGQDCYGVVEVYEDKIKVIGQGTFGSADWSIQKSKKKKQVVVQNTV